MSKYTIWKVECATCEWDEVCGEDEGSIPAECPSCGAEGEWWEEE